ncbi:hypothetical protein NP493_682g00000 [Ridgeia piscesae]|uniref:Endonuclease/exonuclease/phosphatase domain-containing protein n=1 Tax=Ridgeia piscesae TaxID=27915 RepID=A0AAD9NPM2_RIDPI|nr:hypothetical protein NP493_682g00000 [Ridgeia piscesae]
MGDVNKMKDSHLKRNHNLKHIVDLPSRGNAVLYNIYTNVSNFYQCPVICAPIGLSDHKVVVCILSPSSKYTSPDVSCTPSRSHKPRDRARFEGALQTTSWETLFRLPTCEEQLNFFNSIIRTLLDVHLPERQIRRCSNDRPWVDDNFRHLFRRRQRAFPGGDRILYNKYRNKVNRERKSLQRRYHERKIQALEKDHPKRWWNNITNIAGIKVHCDSLQGFANSHCAGKLDVLADDVCDFLQSVTTNFTQLSPDDTFLPLGAVTSVPDTYIISVAEVTDSISWIKTKKAAGPDETPNWILRDYATTLAPPVCAIFNSSLREGIVPQLWKYADIRPLSKVQLSKFIHKDLRQISLTPELSKCLEHFICARITAIAGDPQQFGSVSCACTYRNSAQVESCARFQRYHDPCTTRRLLQNI